jgi:hypothetical protein
VTRRQPRRFSAKESLRADIRANIVLGAPGEESRLRLRNEDGATAVQLRASDANVTNLFSNEADQSNGLVKAWARINFDGTIIACWRCNTDTAETNRITTGQYEVDFTPLATDITGRPLLADIDRATLSSSRRRVAMTFKAIDPLS